MANLCSLAFCVVILMVLDIHGMLGVNSASLNTDLDDEWVKRVAKVLEEEEVKRGLEEEQRALVESKKVIARRKKALGEENIAKLEASKKVAAEKRLAKELEKLDEMPCTFDIPAAGGIGGDDFDDKIKFAESGYSRITGFSVRYGNMVDCLGMRYGSVQAECHGGSGGQLATVNLRPYEVIVGITGNDGVVIDNVVIHTNFQTYGPYGGSGGDPFRSFAPSEVAYISGAADGLLDRLELHYLCHMRGY